MVDIDELERLVAQAPSTTWRVVDGHYPSFRKIEGPSFRIDCVMWASDLSEIDYVNRKTELELIAALRNAAEELIRDARRWRALDAAMAERGHQWTTTSEQVAAMLKILKEPT